MTLSRREFLLTIAGSSAAWGTGRKRRSSRQGLEGKMGEEARREEDWPMAVHPGKDAGRWACYADRLFDGEQVRSDQALLIEGPRIADVVPLSAVPPELPRLTAPGGTILPGLIDVHVHFTRWQGPLFLAWGVTTVRDVGNDPAWILARRAEAAAYPWPHLFCVGPMLDGPNPFWGFCRPCADVEAARQAVRETAALGVDGIKFYPGLPSDWLPAMVEEARQAPLPTMMHCSDVPGAMAAGVEEFFHLDGLLEALWPGHPPGWLEVWGHEDFPAGNTRWREVADRIAASGMITTPTLFYWDFAWQIRHFGVPDAPPDSLIPAQNLAWLRAFPGHQRDAANAERWHRALRNAQAFLRLLVERGVPILPGTDEPWGLLPPGQSLWREMVLLAECGMEPGTILRAATAQAAQRLRAEGRGRLRPGYAADLVVVTGDPTKTLTDHPEIQAVVRDGKIFSPVDLRARAAEYATTVETDPLGREFRQKASGTM